METRTRQLDASASASTRRHRRPGRQEARTPATTPGRRAGGASLAARPGAGHETAAQIPGPRPPRPSPAAALGARLARACRLVPPATAPIASCAPSHATSGGS